MVEKFFLRPKAKSSQNTGNLNSEELPKRKNKFDTEEEAKSYVEFIRENYCDCNYCLIKTEYIPTKKDPNGRKDYYILPSYKDTKAKEFYKGNWGPFDYEPTQKTIKQRSYCCSY